MTNGSSLRLVFPSWPHVWKKSIHRLWPGIPNAAYDVGIFLSLPASLLFFPPVPSPLSSYSVSTTGFCPHSNLVRSSSLGTFWIDFSSKSKLPAMRGQTGMPRGWGTTTPRGWGWAESRKMEKANGRRSEPGPGQCCMAGSCSVHYLSEAHLRASNKGKKKE